MATLNIGMKVNRAITGATTVNANATAIVTYSQGIFPTTAVGSGAFGGWNGGQQGMIINRVFGPGQSIPASFIQGIRYKDSSAVDQTTNITWTLISGVELINTQ